MEDVTDDRLGFLVNDRYAQERQSYISIKNFLICAPMTVVFMVFFFQSEKYFKNVEDVVRREYTFHDEHLEPCQAIMEE